MQIEQRYTTVVSYVCVQLLASLILLQVDFPVLIQVMFSDCLKIMDLEFTSLLALGALAQYPPV